MCGRSMDKAHAHQSMTQVAKRQLGCCPLIRATVFGIFVGVLITISAPVGRMGEVKVAFPTAVQ